MVAQSLGARVKRLLTANVHAVVTSLENMTPQALLEQYLREFDEVIDATRAALGQHEAAKHQAARAIARLNNEVEQLADQISLALDKGDEKAAHAGAARQIDLEDQISVLNQSLQDIIGKAEAAESDLLGLRSKRSEMEKVLQERIAAQAVAAQNSAMSNVAGFSSSGVSTAQRAEYLEQEFNRTLAKASGVAGAGTTAGQVDPMQLKKLQDMQREARVSERLERLRASRPAKQDA